MDNRLIAAIPVADATPILVVVVPQEMKLLIAVDVKKNGLPRILVVDVYLLVVIPMIPHIVVRHVGNVLLIIGIFLVMSVLVIPRKSVIVLGTQPVMDMFM